MSYYQGDFYKGDPGLFSFLGRAAKAAVGFIPGVGPIAKQIIDVGSRIIPAGTGAAKSAIMKVPGTVAGAIVKHPALSAAGAAGALGAATLVGAGAERMLAAPGMCPKGFHISKSKHARSFGKCVRNRRMNVANGRALSRAVRRLHHFARKYRKVVGFVSPRKPKGRMYFKKKKRAA